MLQQRYMFEQWSNGSPIECGEKAWAKENKLLGNVVEGFNLNSFREQNVAEVKISPSISCILKSHQVCFLCLYDLMLN